MRQKKLCSIQRTAAELYNHLSCITVKISEENKQFTALVIMEDMVKASVVYMHRVLKIVQAQ
jgi:hypothetical protein